MSDGSNIPMPSEAPAPRPLGEWVSEALLDAGLSETDTIAAVEATLPLFLGYLDELAGQVEFRYRSMTFHRGGCDSETKLHPAGAHIRGRAAAIRTWLDEQHAKALTR